MKFKQSLEIKAEPFRVFDAFKEVSKWSIWDPETESASLNGDFAVGTSGVIKPKGAPQSKMTLIEVIENRSFTVECKLPLCKMHFVHLMNPSKIGTNLSIEVEFSGFLAPVFGRLAGKDINKGLPNSLNGLRQYLD